MSTHLEVSIVRIRNKNNIVVGAGFLVTENLVLTCAHVVAQVLGISQDASDIPTGNISLDFPLVVAGKILTAKVIKWSPVQADGSGDDIACLELLDTPPKETHPSLLIAEEDLWGHPFRVFGFPAGYENGVWASGVLRVKQADGWIQIEDVKQTGYFIEPGFSGTAIWDEQVNGVVGMTVAAERRHEVRAAFVIPTTRVLERFPELTQQTIQLHRELLASQKQANSLQVFICYAKEDEDFARQLYNDLKWAGVKPWIACEDILPGKPWKSEIKRAMKKSSYFLALLSTHSVSKRGYVQKELKEALELLDQLPPSKIFLIPVRIEKCEPEDERLQELHWVDLFPPSYYKTGLARILRVLLPESQSKKAASDVLHYEEGLVEGKQRATEKQKPRAEHLDKEKQPSERTQKTPVVHLRSESLTVSKEEAQKVRTLGFQIREFSDVDLFCGAKAEIARDFRGGFSGSDSTPSGCPVSGKNLGADVYYDSYASRLDKGIHAAVKRLQDFARKVMHNGSQPAFYMQLDIRNFFMSINKHILFSLIQSRC